MNFKNQTFFREEGQNVQYKKKCDDAMKKMVINKSENCSPNKKIGHLIEIRSKTNNLVMITIKNFYYVILYFFIFRSIIFHFYDKKNTLYVMIYI